MKNTNCLCWLAAAALVAPPLALARHHEPDAVTADPDHYSVEYENDSVRILRVDYGPGATSVMHKHPATCAIILAGGEMEMETADGEVIQNDMPPGSMQCNSATVHKPTNTGDGRSQVILVELKGRDTP